MASDLDNPRVALYTGEGSSHSWLWFVDLFERLGLWELEFIDEAAVRGGALKAFDILAVSGGDTFALAVAMGAEGASAIRRFVDGGGLYLGSCAGAYLPMYSSKEPLSLFNFAKVKIANLTSELPPGLISKEKAFTPYGCRYVFHPVRESVRLRMQGDCLPSIPRFFEAPLYGGPAMMEGEGCDVIARYDSFSKRTVFLADEETSTRTLLDKAAVIRFRLGKGYFYLFGPHLEHPCYPEANRLVGEIMAEEKGAMLLLGAKMAQGPKTFRGLAAGLRRELGNARITASSLEFEPVRWTIGSKTYDPERIRVFIEAVWRRIALLGDIEPDADLLAEAGHISLLLRETKAAVSDGRAAEEIVRLLLPLLKRFAASFFSLYFRSRRVRVEAEGKLYAGKAKRR